MLRERARRAKLFIHNFHVRFSTDFFKMCITVSIVSKLKSIHKNHLIKVRCLVRINHSTEKCYHSPIKTNVHAYLNAKILTRFGGISI